MNRFGGRMHCKKIGWSQQKLAEKAGLSYNTITKIKQGAATMPTIQTVVKIADAFGISVDELLGRQLHER